MNKIILTGFIFIIFLIEVSSQTSTKRINLKNINDREFSEAITKTEINFLMPDDGRFIYLLSNNKLFIVNTIEQILVTSNELNFTTNNLNSFLLTSGNEVGVLTYDPVEVTKMDVEKVVKFYRLDENYNVFDSIQFILEENFVFLESDIYGLSHYVYNNDTLIINFGGFYSWFINKGKILPLSFDKKPGKYKIVDFKNGNVFDLNPIVVKSPDSILIYFEIYLGDKLILDSRNDLIEYNDIIPPYFNFEFPLFYAYDNQFYFNGDLKYQYSIKDNKWFELPSKEYFHTYNLFGNGFYNYDSQNGIFTIIYTSN